MARIIEDLYQMTQVQNWLHTVVTFAAIGDNTIINAPGTGKRIVIKTLIIQDEVSNGTIAIVKSGSVNHIRLHTEKTERIIFSFAYGDEWRLAPNVALIINLDGAHQHAASVRYCVENV